MIWKKDRFLSQTDGVSQTECAIVPGRDIYNGWMKNEKSAMISCNDGFRPVSFLIEALEEEAD